MGPFVCLEKKLDDEGPSLKNDIFRTALVGLLGVGTVLERGTLATYCLLQNKRASSTESQHQWFKKNSVYLVEINNYNGEHLFSE